MNEFAKVFREYPFQVLEVVLVVFAIAVVADDNFKTPNIFESIQIILLAVSIVFLEISKSITSKRAEKKKK